MTLRGLLKRKVIRALAQDTKATTAVELAMVAPVLIIVLVGIIELSLAMFINTVVEGSLKDASRLGLTGQIQEGSSNTQALVDMLNEASLGLLGLTTADVTTLVYENFAYVGQGEEYTDLSGDGSWTPGPYTHSDGTVYPDGEPWVEVNGNGIYDEDFGVAGMGAQGDIVLYTVEYNWNFLSGQVIPILGGIIPMRASIVVRNEPY
ncbi:TadE/TadG family type IV pilus assembly protein [uncultured Sneathiella sp.]|jgi:Flp pilus assembly protein TadG|uniref:TadE/TadG family type IV pilus assembly protein n=1 Tax=uncultured Sneathiella sp. TaxID=879315 RepID=UPI0030DCF8E4|tara:strand:- start:421 stop:1038 length:618 start_codon:yes stop_codon:yes gene_type:complete